VVFEGLGGDGGFYHVYGDDERSGKKLSRNADYTSFMRLLVGSLFSGRWSSFAARWKQTVAFR